MRRGLCWGISVVVSRVNNAHVLIKPSAFAVHGISAFTLKDEPSFRTVGTNLNAFFNSMYDAGVLVAHNGSTDFQFLACDYLRAGLQLPVKIAHTMCTLKTVKRFSSLAYRKANPAQWSVLTDKGNCSMCVNAMATFALKQKDPPATFESHCGRHHDAQADVKGVAVILFDYDLLGKNGMWYKVFHSKFDVCVSWKDNWDAMTLKMDSPVVKFEPVPRGWTSATDAHDQDCAPSSSTLPNEVDPVPEPRFTPANQRGSGRPSPKLFEHLRKGGTVQRGKW